MTDRDKKRLNELEEKTAYLLAQQDRQEAQLHQVMARLAYIEARQYRLMKLIGIPPEQVDTLQTAQDDAKNINLSYISTQRFN